MDRGLPAPIDRSYQQPAVHAAMAGRTDCVVGNQDDWYTLVPIRLATIERQQVNLNSDLWRAVLDATGQTLYFGGNTNGGTSS